MCFVYVHFGFSYTSLFVISVAKHLILLLEKNLFFDIIVIFLNTLCVF